MNYSGEAADQILRVTIQGTEVALKLTGKAAERVIVLIYAILKGTARTAGKTRLESMLKSGKEITVFTIPGHSMAEFASEAKRYGVLYCAIKDKKDGDARITDVMVYKEDASKINRIVERMGLATVDMDKATAVPEKEGKEAEKAENPTKAGMGSRRRLEPTSRSKGTQGAGIDEAERKHKKSVRKDMEELRAKRAAERKKDGRSQDKDYTPVFGNEQKEAVRSSGGRTRKR